MTVLARPTPLEIARPVAVGIRCRTCLPGSPAPSARIHATSPTPTARLRTISSSQTPSQTAAPQRAHQHTSYYRQLRPPADSGGGATDGKHSGPILALFAAGRIHLIIVRTPRGTPRALRSRRPPVEAPVTPLTDDGGIPRGSPGEGALIPLE